MREIPETTWTIAGLARRNLPAGSLGDAIGTEPTLLVFLRHLG